MSVKNPSVCFIVVGFPRVRLEILRTFEYNRFDSQCCITQFPGWTLFFGYWLQVCETKVSNPCPCNITNFSCLINGGRDFHGVNQFLISLNLFEIFTNVLCFVFLQVATRRSKTSSNCSPRLSYANVSTLYNITLLSVTISDRVPESENIVFLLLEHECKLLHACVQGVFSNTVCVRRQWWI